MLIVYCGIPNLFSLLVIILVELIDVVNEGFFINDLVCSLQ